MTVDEYKSSFKILVELSDRIIREEMGDFYYVSASRMDNLLYCLESGATQINALTKRAETAEAEVKCWEDEVDRLQALAIDCEALRLMTEERDRYKAMADGATTIVELYRPQSPAQEAWKANWLRQAR